MGKYYYNGVLLPEIPANKLAAYPYCWIRNDGANACYNLVFSATPWYYFVEATTGEPRLSKGTAAFIPYYSLAFDGYESAESWGFPTESMNDFGLASNRTVLWSNHDMPNGSADATEIYFYASEPVAEGDVPQPITDYRISSTRLKAIADQVRRLGNVEGKLTPAQMVTTLMGIATGSAEG